MSLAAVIARRATSTLTVTRAAAPTIVAGLRVAGASTSFSTRAVVQPAGGEDLDRLSEGRLATEARMVWTADELRIGDRLNIEGGSWEVEGVFDRSLDGGFHKALARKVPA